MNDGEIVPVTSWSKGDLQLWASGWGIGREVTKLNHAHGRLKSVLTVMEGKEIHNVELARSLREASGMDLQGDDLRSELEYYLIRDRIDGPRFDGSQGLLVVEEGEPAGTAAADGMPLVRESFRSLCDHHIKMIHITSTIDAATSF
ncbi:hypothetical protein VPH35_056468 [Triticum aestivum]